MGLLDGKVALVTGGAQGLGNAIAHRFVAAGAQVVIADLDGDAASDAATELGDDGFGVRANVVEDEDWAASVATTVEHFGRLDVVVNNAGITRDATIGNMSLEDFRMVVDVHLQGTWLGTKHGFAHWKEQGHGGAVVNMSSVSGKIGNFGQTNYAAAKAGIVGMTKSAAREGARYGVRVNAVMPGLIDSAMTRAMPEDAWERAMDAIPLGRAGQPEEVAEAALFLASDLSSYSTGIVVEVNGGRHI